MRNAVAITASSATAWIAVIWYVPKTRNVAAYTQKMPGGLLSTPPSAYSGPPMFMRAAMEP